MKRSVFFISDRTGITAEMLGQALLAQFEGIDFDETTLPFIDNEVTARQAVQKIDQAYERDGLPPIIFDTMVRPELRAIIRESKGMVLDMFQTFVAPLEETLGMRSTHAINRLHHNADTDAYKNRIEAINYSLAHDDGQSNQNLVDANVILVGVSRVGKTPTSLYLAMQYGLKAANYPLIPEDFERGRLPKDLLSHKQKIFGLTIDPERLSEIRNERRPGSNYAKLENCRYEINEATAMMHGAQAAQDAAETARKTFEEGVLSSSLPTVEVPRAEYEAGIGVLTAFVKAGLVASTGEARRQIKGGILDGPLAFDNAISLEAAQTKGIKSAVAGMADILVVPDLESGNMVAKQLEYLASAVPAGIVLGARVPIILTSRADNAETRMASCVLAVLIANANRLKT